MDMEFVKLPFGKVAIVPKNTSKRSKKEIVASAEKTWLAPHIVGDMVHPMVAEPKKIYADRAITISELKEMEIRTHVKAEVIKEVVKEVEVRGEPDMFAELLRGIL